MVFETPTTAHTPGNTKQRFILSQNTQSQTDDLTDHWKDVCIEKQSHKQIN